MFELRLTLRLGHFQLIKSCEVCLGPQKALVQVSRSLFLAQGRERLELSAPSSHFNSVA